MEETDYFVLFPPTWGRVGDISIIFPCSFAVGITQQCYDERYADCYLKIGRRFH